ncbi:zinc finger MYM-type protein 1-like [Aphis craccivora]|uniref:Zinc finger MYM-type protein 1-like n=1 Tax=Aphis craccivora TaxID=307492 RepID=A0A6G0YIX4_APHCR|nr:zinc finger MYM-type protein 1-like [Aphis craccivora]
MTDKAAVIISTSQPNKITLKDPQTTHEITVKKSYEFIQMYQSDISLDTTSQLLSIKEIIKNTNLNSIKALASFILENNFATSSSDISGACIIYGDDPFRRIYEDTYGHNRYCN